MRLILFLTLFLFAFSCRLKYTVLDENTVKLEVLKVAPNTYRYISYLETESFGRVACNGMIVMNNGEAIIIDPPTNSDNSDNLIQYVQNELKAEIKAVVVTHFHEDCLGGLKSFHDKNISSYSYFLTQELAKKNGEETPLHTFKDSIALTVGKEELKLYYLGAGHTVDNIVAFFPKSNSMFGGCLVKSMGAGKGNLADARVQDWSQTIEKVQQKFPDVEHVIPGHGKDGGKEMLEYTRVLFAQ